MNPFPWMRYWIGDFENDQHVSVMSTLALGAYHRLLWRAWHQSPVGTLPNDDVLLAHWARLTPDEWRSVKSELGPCFTPSRDNRLVQKRMAKEYQAVATDKRQKSAAGKKAVSARWGIKKDLDTTVLRTNNDRNTNSESDTEKNNNTAGGVVVVQPVAAREQTRRELPPPNRLAEPPAPAPKPPDAVAAALLKGQGVTEAIADELAVSTSVDRVRELVEAGRRRLTRREITEDQIPGFLVAGIRNGYVVTGGHVDRGKPPDERRQDAAATVAKSVAARKSEAEQVAADESRGIETLKALPSERLARLKIEVLTGKPEMLRAKLANADPVSNLILRSMILEKIGGK